MAYRIETTDPISGRSLEQLMNMPYVIENDDDDSLIIYFESEQNRDLYLEDPNMVIFFRDGLYEMLGEGVDLLFANQDEACELAQSKDLNETIESIKTVAKTFAITRGSAGAILYDGSDLIEISAHKVEAIDTLGAGDLFAGAFIYGLSQGMDFKQSGELASLASSKIVTQYGPDWNKFLRGYAIR